MTKDKKRNKEGLNRFVSRYCRLAAKYLMRAGSKSSCQTREILSIMLLNNPSMLEFTLTNAKIGLIGMEEERSRNEERDNLKISLDLKEG